MTNWNGRNRLLARADYEVFTVACDISDRDGVVAMVDTVSRHYGHIDILVNNAGEIMVSPFENLEVADFERAMAVMFWGTLYTTLAVLPSMKARGHGRIVNVTSIGGKVSVPHLLSYSCAKAAAVAFSNGLRNEVRQFGIEVTTIDSRIDANRLARKCLFQGRSCRGSQLVRRGRQPARAKFKRGTRGTARRKGICAGKTESVLGVPAQILSRAQTLLPGLTADVLRLSNALLPKGGTDHSMQIGRDLEDRHGSLYRLLTTLGRRAGQRLNQPV